MPSAPPPPPPAARRAPEDDDANDPLAAPLALRVATGIGAGAVAAALAIVPATMRLMALPTHADGLSTFLACAATTVPAMILAVFVLRRARVGIRTIAGADPAARGVGLALWLVLLFLFLATFGALLRATTHHHALAGTTFALIGLFAAVGLGVVSARVSAIVAARGERTRRALLLVTSLFVALTAIFAAMRMARALGSTSGEPSPAGALFIDVLAFAIAALFFARPAFVAPRWLAYTGPVIAVVLVAGGLVALRVSGVGDAIAEHAPALAAWSGPIAGH